MTDAVPLRPNVLEIDLDAAVHNVRAVRRLIGPDRTLFAVVKADAYGFGAARLGAVFARHGADYLAVADLDEGVRLRRHAEALEPDVHLDEDLARSIRRFGAGACPLEIHHGRDQPMRQGDGGRRG